MQVKLIPYYFDVSKERDRELYDEMKSMLKESREVMDVYAKDRWWESYGETVLELTIDKTFVFSNQWNTEPYMGEDVGRRVFDWFECIYPNKNIKAGYYLQLNEAHISLRLNTVKCGYCGYQEHKAGNVFGIESGDAFCTKCLGSEYLKPDELRLLRLKPVIHFNPKRAPLTESESARLTPLYNSAQKKTTCAKWEKLIGRLENGVEKSQRKLDIFKFLPDHNIYTVSQDNIIYYDHKDEVVFGWRAPLTFNQEQELLKQLREHKFPYNYSCEVR